MAAASPGQLERLQAQLQQERAKSVELETELEVERTAHNSTAERARVAR